MLSEHKVGLPDCVVTTWRSWEEPREEGGNRDGEGPGRCSKSLVAQGSPKQPCSALYLLPTRWVFHSLQPVCAGHAVHAGQPGGVQL